eukprot:CAMPEP_0180101144 /NCGR_PEP_ID=MMETSP0985-20121206/29356_1 /TAXON_ID=483367 /ORGANISM="non described non described, Strain CCMP 2436" /LENGTH=208 /DNA_ID=CAMNT_0022037089 /DNA_START=258 /DNA_END=884 /DNA_ORIENTATION=-
MSRSIGWTALAMLMPNCPGTGLSPCVSALAASSPIVSSAESSVTAIPTKLIVMPRRSERRACVASCVGSKSGRSSRLEKPLYPHIQKVDTKPQTTPAEEKTNPESKGFAVPRAALAKVSVTVEMTERISWLHHETQLAAPNARLSRSVAASTLYSVARAAQRHVPARRRRAAARPGWRGRSGSWSGARTCMMAPGRARTWKREAPATS